jgi:hypothetical protein
MSICKRSGRRSGFWCHHFVVRSHKTSSSPMATILIFLTGLAPLRMRLEISRSPFTSTNGVSPLYICGEFKFQHLLGYDGHWLACQMVTARAYTSLALLGFSGACFSGPKFRRTWSKSSGAIYRTEFVAGGVTSVGAAEVMCKKAAWPKSASRAFASESISTLS